MEDVISESPSCDREIRLGPRAEWNGYTPLIASATYLLKETGRKPAVDASGEAPAVEGGREEGEGTSGRRGRRGVKINV